jgi:hypothetical protein
MQIPRRVLEVVAGPLIATAAMSCASPEAVITPEPMALTPVTVAEMPVDPVLYDATREADRLARTDARDASVVVERKARIDDEEREALGRSLFGSIGPMPDYIMAGCGRG